MNVTSSLMSPLTKRLHIHIMHVSPFLWCQCEKEVHKFHARHQSKNFIKVVTSCYMNTHTTRRALCLTISPACFLFSLYTQFRMLVRWPCDMSAISYTAFCCASIKDEGSSMLIRFSSPIRLHATIPGTGLLGFDSRGLSNSNEGGNEN
jgi:hypothetical protein